MMALKERIQVASGEGNADLLIKNGRVVDVFSGQIEKKDVAIFGGIIVGIGDYQARKVIDVKGDFLCPGLIDGHVHIESSMVTIPEFAHAVLPHGTTTVVITHNAAIAAMADVVVRLADGRVASIERPAERRTARELSW